MSTRRTAREEYDEYDDQDMPPRRRQQNGCLQAILFVTIGGIITLALILLVGRQLISNVTPRVPDVREVVKQVVATPTPKIIDKGGTILQIKNLNRLETQSQSIERIIEASIERGNPLDLVLGDKLLLIASGEVIAGIDMSKIKESDVTISDDGESISLNLPPSEILSNALDNERTRVYDRQTGIFAPTNKDLETQARNNAEAEILRAACENNIMQKAADQAQQNMEQFLKLAGFENVTVTASAGPCTSPRS